MTLEAGNDSSGLLSYNIMKILVIIERRMIFVYMDDCGFVHGANRRKQEHDSGFNLELAEIKYIS